MRKHNPRPPKPRKKKPKTKAQLPKGRQHQKFYINATPEEIAKTLFPPNPPNEHHPQPTKTKNRNPHNKNPPYPHTPTASKVYSPQTKPLTTTPPAKLHTNINRLANVGIKRTFRTQEHSA